MELPNFLKYKRVLMSLKNCGKRSFKWSILAALHYDEVLANTKSKYYASNAKGYLKWHDELNFDGINFPFHLEQFEDFKKQNEDKRIAVNIFGFNSEKKHIYPIILTSRPVHYKYVNLLMLTTSIDDDDQNTSENHFFFIKNYGRLVSGQRRRNNHKLFICDNCLKHFRSYETLENHIIRVDFHNADG